MKKLSFIDFARRCDFTPMPYQVALIEAMEKGEKYIFLESPRVYGGLGLAWMLQLNEMRERWLRGETTEYHSFQYESLNRPRVIYDEIEFAKAYLNQW
ncbi:MAG: hypothetical protein ACOYZ6_08020 [Chloroflexota bacterium]